MDETNARTMAWDALERLLADAEQSGPIHNDSTGETEEWDPEFPNPDDVLAIDKVRVAKVLLTCNGPTIWVEYHFSDLGSDGLEFDRAFYCTTDNPSSNVQRIELENREAEMLAEVYCYGVEMLAETLNG